MSSCLLYVTGAHSRAWAIPSHPLDLGILWAPQSLQPSLPPVQWKHNSYFLAPGSVPLKANCCFLENHLEPKLYFSLLTWLEHKTAGGENITFPAHGPFLWENGERKTGLFMTTVLLP